MNTELLQDRTNAAIEWSRDLQTKHNIDVHAANDLLYALQLNQFLEAIAFDGIKQKIEQNPKDYFEVLQKLIDHQSERTKRLKVDQELEIHRDHVAEQKRKLEETVAAGKTENGLTPETLKEIEEVMAQL